MRTSQSTPTDETARIVRRLPGRRLVHTLRPRPLTAILLVLTVAATLMLRDDSSYVEVRPRPPVPAADLLNAPAGGEQAGNQVHVLTVSARPVSNARGIWCQLTDRCEVLTIAKGYTRTQAEQQMRTSIDTAVQLTHRDRPQLPDAGPPSPTRAEELTVSDVGGPSAGLAWYLHLTDQQVPGTLFPVPVAATGALTPDGAIEPVGAVPAKIRSAVAAGIPVVFVPAAEAAQAREAATGTDVEIVPVSRAADAIAWLCKHPATTSGRCTP